MKTLFPLVLISTCCLLHGKFVSIMDYLITQTSLLNSQCLSLQDGLSYKCLILFHVTLLVYREIHVFTVFLFLLDITSPTSVIKADLLIL